MNVSVKDFAAAMPDRDRDGFLRDLLLQMARALEEAVGLQEAEGFISVVGNRIGEMVNAEYLAAFGVERMDAARIARTLVDLKDRIEGGFAIESLSPSRIVLVNTACPFGAQVAGRRSLCMTTSSIFGRIAADNAGYARVELQSTIAGGDGRCRVVVDLDPDSGDEGGLEYHG